MEVAFREFLRQNQLEFIEFRVADSVAIEGSAIGLGKATCGEKLSEERLSCSHGKVGAAGR